MASGNVLLEAIDPRRRATGSSVVVISASPINRIILAQSIEGIYRQTTCVDGWESFDTLNTQELALVVLDLTREHATLGDIVASLIELRNRRNDGFPRILGITKGGQAYDGSVRTAMVLDAMISMPLTQDKIQASVARLLNQGLAH